MDLILDDDNVQENTEYMQKLLFNSSDIWLFFFHFTYQKTE